MFFISMSRKTQLFPCDYLSINTSILSDVRNSMWKCFHIDDTKDGSVLYKIKTVQNPEIVQWCQHFSIFRWYLFLGAKLSYITSYCFHIVGTHNKKKMVKWNNANVNIWLYPNVRYSLYYMVVKCTLYQPYATLLHYLWN